MFFLRKWFTKNKKTYTIEEINIGDLVFIEFYKPEEIGIVSPGSTTYTRFNDFELKKCKVHGTVIKKYKEPLAQQDIIIVGSVIPETQSQRQYMFLGQEIKKITKVTE